MKREMRKGFIQILSLLATLSLMGCNINIKGEGEGKPVNEENVEFQQKQEEQKLPIRTIIVRTSVAGLDETKKYFLELAAADGKLLFANRPKPLPEICNEKDVFGDANRLVFKCHEFFKKIPITAQEVGKDILLEIFEAPELPIIKLRLLEETEEEFPILVSEILGDLDQPNAIKINASSTFVYQLYFNGEFEQHYDLACLIDPYRKMRDQIALKYREYQLANPELVDSTLQEALLTIDQMIYQEDLDLQQYFDFLNVEHKCLLEPEGLD